MLPVDQITTFMEETLEPGGEQPDARLAFERHKESSDLFLLSSVLRGIASVFSMMVAHAWQAAKWMTCVWKLHVNYVWVWKGVIRRETIGSRLAK